MRRAIALVLLASIAAPALAKSGSLPRAYRGDWAARLELCAPGPSDSANIRITRRTVWDFESRFDLRTIAPQQDGSIILAGRQSHGTSRYNTVIRLALRDDGATLVMGEGEDTSTYVRCVP